MLKQTDKLHEFRKQDYKISILIWFQHRLFFLITHTQTHAKINNLALGNKMKRQNVEKIVLRKERRIESIKKKTALKAFTKEYIKGKYSGSLFCEVA